ncbi:MAG: hypothetical protein HC905_12205 [Bacteroidales bacterium]|nr:hypothetical protein [Bacteroidales bacterium]
MQTDKYGKKVWNSSPGKEFVNAVPQLFKTANEYFFFGMHVTSLEAILFKVNISDKQVTEVKRFPEITYPYIVAATAVVTICC